MQFWIFSLSFFCFYYLTFKITPIKLFFSLQQIISKPLLMLFFSPHFKKCSPSILIMDMSAFCIICFYSPSFLHKPPVRCICFSLFFLLCMNSCRVPFILYHAILSIHPFHIHAIFSACSACFYNHI